MILQLLGHRHTPGARLWLINSNDSEHVYDYHLNTSTNGGKLANCFSTKGTRVRDPTIPEKLVLLYDLQ